MTQRAVALQSRRVAVVTTSLSPGSNELWEAARPSVRDLVVVGAGQSSSALRPGEVGLRQVDGGKGLIWRHLVGLRRYLKDLEPDLVHINGELWGVTAQELMGIRARVVVHGAENLWDHGNPVERAVRRRLVARAVRHIAGYASWNHDGASHISRLAHRRMSPLPTVVVPGVIPPAEFRSVSWNPPPLDPGSPLRVLLVGRLVHEKGFQDVLAAVARMTDRPVEITVCGDGHMGSELRDQASGDGLDLRLMGWLPGTPLATLMAGSHILVQPSLTTASWAEQFGRTVAEAMAVGLPCLVSDSGELPWLVERVQDAIFPEGSATLLAQKLAAATRSSETLAALSRRQRSCATKYTPEVAGERILAFWDEALT